MADDLDNTGAEDRSRIAINDPHDVRCRTQHLDISDADLRKAVAAVGISATAVADLLGKT